MLVILGGIILMVGGLLGSFTAGGIVFSSASRNVQQNYVITAIFGILLLVFGAFIYTGVKIEKAAAGFALLLGAAMLFILIYSWSLLIFGAGLAIFGSISALLHHAKSKENARRRR